MNDVSNILEQIAQSDSFAQVKKGELPTTKPERPRRRNNEGKKNIKPRAERKEGGNE